MLWWPSTFLRTYRKADGYISFFNLPCIPWFYTHCTVLSVYQSGTMREQQ